MPVLALACRLVSPFHTAGERYSNVQTCAPYILGSTLRGAILSQVIRRHCPEQHFAKLLEDGNNPAYHLACPGPCRMQRLFDPAQTRFSFGEFNFHLVEPASRTRIALDRARQTVAEGPLQYEVLVGREPSKADIKEGKGHHFHFTVTLSAAEDAPAVVEAAKQAGEAGIGAFRNQGLGRFQLTGKSFQPHEPALPAPLQAGEVPLTVHTPYLLDGRPFGETALRPDFDAAVGQAGWSEEAIAAVRVEEVLLGYVGRWSYERGCRESAPVALPGSKLHVSLKRDLLPQEVAAITGGVGTWAEVGFGVFRVEMQADSRPV